jgi:hypothetical protein
LRQALKDLNEHRMTKFEFALYVTKLLEDFLTDDVTFNFVRIFVPKDPPPLLPPQAEHFYTPDKFKQGEASYVPSKDALDDDEMKIASACEADVEQC